MQTLLRHGCLMNTRVLTAVTGTWVRRTLVRRLSTGDKSSNIILMGSPGCGKTTVGRILSKKLDKPVLDIDDDHLEPYWGMPVAQKLTEIGSDSFVQAEGEALCQFNASGSIISLTGSNPMHDEGMQNVSQSGTVFFLDVHPQDVLERLERMKVNRIVGQNEGTPMSDILNFRQQFYEKSYDVRVICERNEDPDSVAEKVISMLNYTQNKSAYVSTRSTEVSDSACPKFSDVMIKSLSKDGGLYIPKTFPGKFTVGELERLVDLNYKERALRVIEHIIPWRDIHPGLIKTFVKNAYSADIFGSDVVFPVSPLNSSGNHGDQGQYILELFHGPTASFKDAALQLMPQLFKYAVSTSGSRDLKNIILVATSGDTGGAVLDGFGRHASDVGVLVLYPQEGISEIQRQQMIALSRSNAQAIGVSGWDFDSCQTAVKQLLNDDTFKQKLHSECNSVLSAANSISWGRLLPQIVFHISSYLELVRTRAIQLGDTVDLCVPTGNFGNILAAFYAKELGIPYSRLICASNSNNVLTDFLNTGVYDLTRRSLQMTSSPAIDILVSSNLERLLFHTSGGDADYVNGLYADLRNNRKFSITQDLLHKLKTQFVADWCDEVDCAKQIRDTLNNQRTSKPGLGKGLRESVNTAVPHLFTDYLLDTHTAVAKAVADRHRADRPMFIAATAHPAKFAEDILKFLGVQTTGLSASDMIRELSKLSDIPKVHGRLSRCVNVDKVGKKIGEPSTGRIQQEIVSLSKSL